MEASNGEKSSSDLDLSSDEELQEGLAEGKLKPGLIGKVAPPRVYINNQPGLQEAVLLLREKRQAEWLECMDVTPLIASPVPLGGEDTAEGGGGLPDPNDDFKREMWFYQQAQSAAQVGRRKLEELGIPTTRPQDYFAEMVKNDDHMKRVREKLLSQQKLMEEKQKARKLRELKKFGKKVQQEILQKRQEKKKSALESIKKYKKGRGEKPSFLRSEEEFPVSTESSQKEVRRKKEQVGSKSQKRQLKDKKFGFGGKKRGRNVNTAESSADMSGFSSARHSQAPGRGKKGTVGKRKSGSKRKQRLGKARRTKMKAKSRT